MPRRCPAHCQKCSDAATCLECEYEGWVLNNATAKCEPCASKGCTACPAGPNICATW